jgi:hypothetical protein
LLKVWHRLLLRQRRRLRQVLVPLRLLRHLLGLVWRLLRQ